ncbi:MAG: alkaline shock response membrane anchor protein AmaP, partial [Streptomyces sp.]|nr:alkaline shock response membrane anchor protein AmaP [Streptomyces sp.]
MRTTANRVLLGLIGLVLLVLGLSVLVGSLDLQRHWGFTVPGWWPFTGPHDVLLTEHSRTRYRSDGWWWPVVFAVLGVLLLGSLWWLLAQARTRRLRQIRVDSGDGQGALLRGRALESVLRSEAEDQDGVEWAGALLAGRRGTPAARL